MTSLPTLDLQGVGAGSEGPAIRLPDMHGARSCVLRVEAEFVINGGPSNLNGTAFHLGNGVFATAGHNFIQHRGDSACRSVATSLVHKGAKYVIDNVNLCEPFKTERNDAFDIALFTLDTPVVSGRYEIESTKNFEPNTKVFVLGYPAEGLTPADKDLHCYSGQAWVRGPFLRYTAHAVKGMSGGPCLVGAKAHGVHIGRDTTSMRAVGFHDALVAFAKKLIQSRASGPAASKPAAA